MFPGPLGLSNAGRALKTANGNSKPWPCANSASAATVRSTTRRPVAAPAWCLRADVVAAAVDAASPPGDARPRLLMSPRGSRSTQAFVAPTGQRAGRRHRLRPFRGGRRTGHRGTKARGDLGRRLCAFGRRTGGNRLLDAIVRLLPGVMGNEGSGEQESFEAGLLEYPHYTRPQDLGRPGYPGSAGFRRPWQDRRMATRNRQKR